MTREMCRDRGEARGREDYARQLEKLLRPGEARVTAALVGAPRIRAL